MSQIKEPHMKIKHLIISIILLSANLNASNPLSADENVSEKVECNNMQVGNHYTETYMQPYDGIALKMAKENGIYVPNVKMYYTEDTHIVEEETIFGELKITYSQALDIKMKGLNPYRNFSPVLRASQNERLIEKCTEHILLDKTMYSTPTFVEFVADEMYMFEALIRAKNVYFLPHSETAQKSGIVGFLVKPNPTCRVTFSCNFIKDEFQIDVENGKLTIIYKNKNIVKS